MRRREFITLLGGAAATWPLAARGQQSRIPVVGFLHAVSPASLGRLVTAFRLGLAETGYVEGRNVVIEFRWAEGRFDELPALAADLVRQQVNVIATPGSAAAALAAKAATPTIPIVFGVPADPVGLGLVTSLARPGGNATGFNFFSTEVVAKRLALLRELLPGAVRVAVLVNPTNPQNTEPTLRDIDSAARTLGLKIQIFNASTSGEIEAAFAALAADRPDALFVGPDGFYNTRRVQLATFAARHAIPTAFSVRDYAEVGGLMSYGTSIPEMFRHVGDYAGRILKGTKPADLPVLQATKFELVINLNTAKALGLTVPPTVLARADEVIE